LPIGTAAQDVRAAQAFIIAIVPLDEVGVDLGDGAEAGEFAGLDGALERAGKNFGEGQSAQSCAEEAGILTAAFGEREVGETGMLAGVAYDANGRTQGGMGADCVDYDGDGLLDLVKTNFSDEMPNLYHNEGKAFFTDVTAAAGMGGETRSVKWGTGFLDFDDDGQPDILIVSGSIYPPGTGTHHLLAQTESKLILMRNLDGHRFTNVSDQAGPAFLDSRCGRGAAFGDIFNTGRISVAVNNLNDYPSLLRNELPSTNSWLLLKLVGTATNRAAIGSRVVVTANNRRQVQEVRSGGSFCSQSDLRLHFGLGTAKEARVQVCWLGGAEEALDHVPANRLVVVKEGKGIISQEAF